MKILISIILFFITSYSNSIISQIQIGQDIDGEHEGDVSGWALSLSADGSRVAIGGYYNSDGGHYAGHVRVFDFIEGEWIQVGQDLDGSSPEGHFGEGVAISDDGQTLIVGAGQTLNNGYKSGLVRVYSWNEDHWQQKGADIIGTGNERSGDAVAISADGNIIAIGVPSGKNNNNIYSGVIRVFHYVDTGWVQKGTDIPGQAGGDEFGMSVSLSDDGLTLVGGADLHNDWTGQVRTYKFNGSNWVKASTDLAGEAVDNRYGNAISLNGNATRLIVGAFANDGNGNASGHARIYKWENNSWKQMGPDLNGDHQQDQYGGSVAISTDGQTIAVGQTGYFQNQNTEGIVRIYKWNGDSWTQYNMAIHGEEAGDFSGNDISISADGSILAIAGFTNDGNGIRSGHVRVYNVDEKATAILTLSTSLYTVYPNPASDKILFKGLDNEKLEIIDEDGKLVFSGIYSNKGINIKTLPAGMYVYKIFRENTFFTGKFLKN